MKTNRFIQPIKKEDGYVWTEASIVFPIMFFIIIILIYAGNMFLLKARIHSEVSKEAIRYANYFSNPLIDDIEKDGYKVKKTAGADLTDDLYRYLFTFGRYSSDAELGDLQERIAKIGLFNNIKAENITVKMHDVNKSIFYQTYVVEVEYTLTFPLKLLFEDSPIKLSMSAREEAPVTDQSELIRNVDMTIDFLETKKVTNGMLSGWSQIMTKGEKLIKLEKEEKKP